MINRIRFIWQLLVIATVLAVLGMALIPKFIGMISTEVFLITLFAVTLVNLVTYLLMSAGIQKNNREGMAYVVGGIGLKFLLYLLFLLLFWLSAKNLTKAFIVTFFALYLMFTFFTAGHLLNLLKNK